MRSVLLVLLLAAAPLFGQHRDTVDVNVLELDVVVLDRDGKPVDGLTRDDFEVAIGKRKAPVTNFYAVRRGAVVDEAPAAAPQTKAAAPAETLISTTVVIFVDDTRLTHHSKIRSLEALEKYVAENVGPTTTAMLVRWNGSLDIRTRPTERAGLIIAELRKMKTEPPAMRTGDRQTMLKAIDDAMLGVTGNKLAHAVQNAWIQLLGYADRESREVEQALDALRQTVKLASVFEGRKALLYVSEGLPLQPAADLFEYWERMTRAAGVEGMSAQLMENIAEDTYRTVNPQSYDRSRLYTDLSNYAQSMKVNVYGLDPGGIRGYERGALEETRRIAEISTMNYRANMQDGVRMVANETGGRFISNENDLSRALTVMSEQFTTYYSIGVRGGRSPKMEDVKVTVKNRTGVRVVTARHRRPLTREEQIERAVRSRLYLLSEENRHNAVIRAGVANKAGDRCVVPLQVQVPRADIVPVGNGGKAIELHFAMLDESFQESGLQRATVYPAGDGAVSHLLSLGVKPGKYMLSLAITDPSTGETSYLQRGFDASGCR